MTMLLCAGLWTLTIWVEKTTKLLKEEVNLAVSAKDVSNPAVLNTKGIPVAQVPLRTLAFRSERISSDEDSQIHPHISDSGSSRQPTRP
jgi:hypothetical protein